MTEINANALDLLRKRYFRPNEQTWEDLCRRVCKGVIQAEANQENKEYWFDIFYNMMSNLEFIPSTPCLINCDKTNTGQLSSCFIVELRDNIESIYDAKSECAKIFQKNGGVGFNIGVLRPKNTPVETSGGKSCGVVGFMEEFDLTADVVTRNNIRKGAIKIDLPIWHPDILEFIHCKDDITKLTHMNISASLSDKFMNAVKNDEDWSLIFPDYSWNKEIYNAEWDGDIDKWINKGYPVKIYQTLKARELYKKIMEHAWKTGEPGVSFVDTMDRFNPNPHMGKVTGSNPCMEFTSIPYNSCNLGSINLTKCVENGTFNWDKFQTLVENSMRFLDNMITVNKLPLDKITNVTKALRSVGLGVMGLADCLYLLKIPYGKNGYDFINNLFKTMSKVALNYSMKLAEERGVYPAWSGSEWEKKGIKVRNSNFLSIAPTGSISFIANVSGGIEPNFALTYSRRTNEGDVYYVTNKIFEDELRKRGLYSDEIMQKIVDNHGSCVGIEEIPKDIQKVFVIASDIDPKQHVEVVGIIQKYVDLSISKTVNLPNSATVEDIEDVYMYAWELGCKGVTVYRDGSRENQTLSVNSDEQKENKKHVMVELPRGYIEDVPDALTYRKYKLRNGCGNLYFFVGVDEVEGKIYDVFTNTNAAGGCTINTQANSRLLSAGMRGGIPIEFLISQLEKSGSCPSYQALRGQQLGMTRVRNMIKDKVPEDVIKNIDEMIGTPVSAGKSCPSSIAIVLKNILKEFEGEEYEPVQYTIASKEEVKELKIKECTHENLRKTEGCVVCPDCGYSKCE